MLKKLKEHLANDGLSSTLRWGFTTIFYYWPRNWWSTRFDRKYGVDTNSTLDLKDYSRQDLVSNAVAYSATPVKVFNRLMKDQKLDFSNYAFVDLGSGKGRTMLLASFLGFREICGVEFEPTLHAIAESNIKNFRKNRRGNIPPIRSVCGDAGGFHLPDGNLVVYMANPFGTKIMNDVAQRIIEALAQPRHIRIVYFHPNTLAELLPISNMRVLYTTAFHDPYSINDVGRVAVLEVTSQPEDG